MPRYVLIFGSIAGLIMVLMMYLTIPFFDESTDYDAAEWLGYITMIIALSAIFVGIKSYRDKELAGHISFGRAFKTGLLMALVASAFYVAGWMVYVSTAGENFMDSYYEYHVQKVRNSDASETEIQAELAEMEKMRELYKNPLVKIGVSFLEIFPVGLLIALISAAVLKKKPELTHRQIQNQET